MKNENIAILNQLLAYFLSVPTLVDILISRLKVSQQLNDFDIHKIKCKGDLVDQITVLFEVLKARGDKVIVELENICRDSNWVDATDICLNKFDDQKLRQRMPGGELAEAKTLVAIGTMGNGKSALCNVLYGHPDFFKESALADSETSYPSTAPAMFKDKPVYVVDTPGFKDSKGNDKQNIETTVKFLKSHPYGLHGIAFVLNGQNPKIDGTDKDLIRLLCNIFKADEFWEHMCIVFTRCFDHPSGKIDKVQRRTEFSHKIREIALEMKINLPTGEMQSFFVDLKDSSNQESNQNIENLKQWLLQLKPIGRLDQMEAADAKYKEVKLSPVQKIPTRYSKRHIRFVKTSSWVEHVHGKKNYNVYQDFQHYKLVQKEIRVAYDGSESFGPEIVVQQDLCEAVTGLYEQTA